LTSPGLNPGRRGGKPATNRFSYGEALLTELIKELLLKKCPSNILKLFLISFVAKTWRTDGHLVSENEVNKVLNALKCLPLTPIPTPSRSEGQDIKPL
jgi:hypothetical protein